MKIIPGLRPLVIAILLAPAAAPAALTQTFDNPATVTLNTRTQLFEPHPAAASGQEELSTASVVLAEQDGSTAASPVLPPLAFSGDEGTSHAKTSDLDLAGARLPVRADRSSTAAQALQLLRFERRNQIAEAFLLASDLVRRNPGDEFALDAAIRTSLVLGRGKDVEALYRQAIRLARLPGKYYVQLAHWYLRTGEKDKFKALLAEFEKTPLRDGEYYLTLLRMKTLAENPSEAREAAELAAKQKVPLLFPMLVLASHAYHQSGKAEEAAKKLLDAEAEDFGPWERRMQLLEYLKLPDITPEGVLAMVDAAMVNEPSHSRARAVADRILDRVLEERIFFGLKTLLIEKIQHDDASDIERWLLALMYQRELDDHNMLRVLQGSLPDDAKTSAGAEETTSSSGLSEEHEFMGGTTPVIAYERAVALGRAGRHAEAVALAFNLLAEQPTEWPLRLLLAEQQLAAGDGSAALRTLSSWVGRHRMTDEERERRAEFATLAAMIQDDPKIIVGTWQELTARAASGELQKMRAAVLAAETPPTTSSEALSLRERVEQHLEELRDENRSSSIWLLRAALAAREDDDDAELNYLLRYLESDPENVAMLRRAAELTTRYASVPIGLQGGKKAATLRATDTSGAELALRLYRRLVELQPRVASNYSALMRVYLMRGEAETAKRVAAELVERNTSSTEALATAARVLHENGFATDALVYYRIATPQSPEDYELWASYAGALRAAGKIEAAQNILHRILEEGLFRRAYAQELILKALFEIANSTSALPALAGYLDSLRTREIPDKQGFLLTAARLLSESGLSDRAEPFVNDFLQAFPDSPLAPAAAALQARLRAGQTDGTLLDEAALPASAELTSPSLAVPAEMEAAEAKVRSGQAAEAMEQLVKLAEKHPTDDLALAARYRAAQIAEQTGDVARAAELIDAFLKSECQNFEVRKEAKAMQARLKGTPR